jgi:hypothetical protein
MNWELQNFEQIDDYNTSTSPFLNRVPSARLYHSFCTHVAMTFAPMQTETYQVAGGDGPMQAR